MTVFYTSSVHRWAQIQRGCSAQQRVFTNKHGDNGKSLRSPPEFLMPTPTYYYIGCGLLLLLALDYYFGCGLFLILALVVSVAAAYSPYCQAHTFVFGALCVFTGGPLSPLAEAGSAVRKAWAPSGHSVRCCCKSRRVKPQLSPV